MHEHSIGCTLGVPPMSQSLEVHLRNALRQRSSYAATEASQPRARKTEQSCSSSTSGGTWIVRSRPGHRLTQAVANCTTLHSTVSSTSTLFTFFISALPCLL